MLSVQGVSGVAVSTADRDVRVSPALLLHASIAVATIVLLSLDRLSALFVGDVARYAQIATGPTFWTGQQVEFPPVTAAFIWLTARWASLPLVLVPLANLVLDLVTALVVQRTWGRRAGDTYLVLAGLMLPITLFRVDHLTVLLAVLGLAAAARGAGDRAGVLLGLGALGKLWPAAVAAGYLWGRARVTAVAAITVVAGGTLWALVFSPDAISQVITFRGSSGWQIESVVGAVLLLGGGTPSSQSGAWRIGTTGPASSLVLLAIGLGVLVATRRVRSPAQRHVALVAALLVTSPLLSPQFLLWLVPLVAVLPTSPVRRQLTGLTAVAILYSVLLGTYYGYVVEGELLAVLALNLRNLCLVAMVPVALQSTPSDVPVAT